MMSKSLEPDDAIPPLRAWKFNHGDMFVGIAYRLLSFFRQNPGAVNFDGKRQCINLLYNELRESLGSGPINFTRTLEETPESLLSACGVAACEFLFGASASPSLFPFMPIPIRILGNAAHEIQSFRDLRAFQIGKFLTVRGNVLRVSAVTPLVTHAGFLCIKCMQIQSLQLPEGIFRQPAKCRTANCRGKIFHVDRASPLTKCINSQRIRLQEIIDPTDSQEEGRIPRVIEVLLLSDLVDLAAPGQTVTISGILKANPEEGDVRDAQHSALYLEANSIEASSLMTVHSVDSVQLRSLTAEKNLLSILVKSFCPQIFGHEMVKLAMLLSIVSGNCLGRNPKGNKPGFSTNKPFSVRADPHVLLVGDPGLGKSQLLRFASLVAPRSVYVSATSSTAVGLTAAVQDGGLEAGALVLADQGCCCIDEFDKIGGDGWRSLLDVMEQQSVNVAKAGVVCTLAARASIIAAANPINGHYNRERSVMDNLKMDVALLSRFDLVFVLLDKPNADMDKVLSEHVLGNVDRTAPGFRTTNPLHISQTQVLPQNARLADRLTSKAINGLASLPESALRMYLAYLRENVHPRMTEEAATVLREFYLEMRKSYRPSDESLPITTRHLESLIRLAEARTKLENRIFVTVADAEDVVELMKISTSDINPHHNPGLSNFGGGGGGGGAKAPRKGSKSAAVKGYVSELIKISARTTEVEFSTTQLQGLFTTLKVTELAFTELVEILNEHGYLLRKSKDVYRLIVT